MVQTDAGDRSSFVLISKGPTETFRIGKILGEGLKAGRCGCADGRAGSGQDLPHPGALPAALVFPGVIRVTSLTFTLINEYPGREAPLSPAMSTA